jgi:tetratricopeptide (TPR) repeat protein
LILVFAVLTVLDLKSNYMAEKQLWKINRKFTEMTKDPKTTPDASFEKIFNKYMAFTEKFPDSRLTPMAKIFAGRTQIFLEDYTKARSIFENILKDHPDKPTLGAQVVAEIGRTHAIEKNGQKIIETYHRILDNYPLTEIGLRTPLYLAKYHGDKKQYGKAKEAFERGIIHYKKLITEYPDTVVEYKALHFISACHLAQQRWQESMNIFEEIMLKFGKRKFFTPQEATALVRSINTIAMAKLNSKEIPIGIYNRFMEKYPDHPFNQILKKVINQIKNFDPSRTQEANNSTEAK